MTDINKPLRYTPDTNISMLPTSSRNADIEWIVTNNLVNYEDAESAMNARVDAIAAGQASECVWLLCHPPLYTAGTSANNDDIVTSPPFPVYTTGRGGQYTYHGPGQRIAYVMLDLKKRGQDVRKFVAGLEEWLITTLDSFNVKGERRNDRVGVWVSRPEKGLQIDGTPKEDKIAAIGIRVRKWVTLHGISLNVEPDLSHFEPIVPCGIRNHGVTSLVDLGLPVTLTDADLALKQSFDPIFGQTKQIDTDFLTTS